MSETLSSFASAFRQIVGSPPAWLCDDGFSELALRLFRLQHAANPDYRRLCDARGVDATGLQDWRLVPAVPTAAFKQAAFSCLPVEQRTRVFESSGTTASVRSRHHHSAESLAVYEASLLPWFQRHLLPELTSGEAQGSGGTSPSAGWRMRFLSLTPAPAAAARSSLVHMLAQVSRQGFEAAFFSGETGPDNAWRVRSGDVVDFLGEAVRGGTPVVVAGTAFNFVEWLDALEAGVGPLALPQGSRVMETGGYKGRTRSLAKAELHSWIFRMLSVPPDRVVTEYGMTELSSQAYDRVAGGSASRDHLRFPPWARARVISAETGKEAARGEVGLLRVVDLANVFSVMAIETEDLAVDDGAGVRLIGRNPGAEPRGCSLHSAPHPRTAASALAR